MIADTPTADGAAAPVVPDGRRVKGDKTRRAILTAAVNVASVEGLEGLSIGRLASELNLSKSGLFAAAAIFTHRVIAPAIEEHEPGLARLCSMLLAWQDYIERGVFAGGCFFAAATVEMDGRPGPVQRRRRPTPVITSIRRKLSPFVLSVRL